MFFLLKWLGFVDILQFNINNILQFYLTKFLISHTSLMVNPLFKDICEIFVECSCKLQLFCCL